MPKEVLEEPILNIPEASVAVTIYTTEHGQGSYALPMPGSEFESPHTAQQNLLEATNCIPTDREHYSTKHLVHEPSCKIIFKILKYF